MILHYAMIIYSFIVIKCKEIILVGKCFICPVSFEKSKRSYPNFIVT